MYLTATLPHTEINAFILSSYSYYIPFNPLLPVLLSYFNVRYQHLNAKGGCKNACEKYQVVRSCFSYLYQKI